MLLIKLNCSVLINHLSRWINQCKHNNAWQINAICFIANSRMNIYLSHSLKLNNTHWFPTVYSCKFHDLEFTSDVDQWTVWQLNQLIILFHHHSVFKLIVQHNPFPCRDFFLLDLYSVGDLLICSSLLISYRQELKNCLSCKMNKARKWDSKTLFLTKHVLISDHYKTGKCILLI